MEQFETEEQQVEAIKRFWKENGMAIVIGAVLGLGGLYGWRWYNEQQIETQEMASTAFDSTSADLTKNEAGFGNAQRYINDNSESGYALLMAFKLAQQAVERKDLDEANKQLSFAMNSASNASVKAIASLRLARVQLEQGQLESALATVEAVNDEAFNAQQQEIKGDVYLAQQLFDKARAAYSAALEANANNPILKMKLDNLATVANG